MKTLTANEVQTVSGGRIREFSGLVFQRGGYFNPVQGVVFAALREVAKKIAEDPGAYGRGVTTWPHYFGRGRAF
ncbi:hypothetical protein [Cardiobacterium hominis]|uniref:hypothetical protein n=1 Tax=Cardiobacterium hominis TaxID=2718 RepID=UPI000F84188D|nr:hypothetical protein [Cardiobacterium hominis]